MLSESFSSNNADLIYLIDKTEVRRMEERAGGRPLIYKYSKMELKGGDMVEQLIGTTTSIVIQTTNLLLLEHMIVIHFNLVYCGHGYSLDISMQGCYNRFFYDDINRSVISQVHHVWL